MTASPVRVDRPAERHTRARGHAVEHRARTDLIEACLERLGRLEAPHDRLVAVAGQALLLFLAQGQVAPAHEHMFVYGPDGRPGVRCSYIPPTHI